MYSALPILALVTFAAAVPAPHDHDAAWEANDAAWQSTDVVSDSGWTQVRDAKQAGIMESLPSPTEALAKLGSFWDWDR